MVSAFAVAFCKSQYPPLFFAQEYWYSSCHAYTESDKKKKIEWLVLMSVHYLIAIQKKYARFFLQMWASASRGRAVGTRKGVASAPAAAVEAVSGAAGLARTAIARQAPASSSLVGQHHSALAASAAVSVRCSSPNPPQRCYIAAATATTGPYFVRARNGLGRHFFF